MDVIVVGCGRVGSELAYRVYKKGHHVTVVDSNEASFRNLPADFRGRTVEGEALNQIVLRRAGIEKADGLAAVTNSDTLNVAVAHVARTVYKVPNVVARNYDASLRGLHEAFGLQVVSSTSWGAQRVEEMLYRKCAPSFRLVTGKWKFTNLQSHRLGMASLLEMYCLKTIVPRLP